MNTALLQSNIAGQQLPRALRPCQQQRLQHRAGVVCAARPDRPKWYPGAEPAGHLDGSEPGDYGFDPLRLGANKERYSWFREAELTNGRWAMAAVAGILFTELIGVGQPWWTQPLQARYPLPLQVGLPVSIAIFAFLEGARYRNWLSQGEGGLLGSAPFDPMGMRSTNTQEKEVKNGRLAMIAFIGFCSQAAVQGMGPIESLKFHLADPAHNNIYTSSVGAEFTVAAVFLSLWPILEEVTKYAEKEQKETSGSTQ